MPAKQPQIDWKANTKLLAAETQVAILNFLKAQGKNDICAIGYVLELGNLSPQFDLCADTHKSRGRYLI